MKKTVILFMTFMMACGLKMFAADEISYLITEGNSYLGTEVRFGLTSMKIKTLDGAVVKVPNKKVDAYMHDSHLFERLPLICENNEVQCMALMEYVTSRSGLRLYRYTCTYEDCDPAALKYGKATEHVNYYVFKDGKFYLRIDKKNAGTALPFFGVNVIL